MLSNKKVTIVLSLVIAICLWTYVVGETNPTVTKTFNNIPIKIKNEKMLEDHGLAVAEVEHDAISVTLKGTRNRMNKMMDTDINAFIDLEEAGKGENLLRVHIQTPAYMEFEGSSISKVKVDVEVLKTKNIPVVVEYSGAENIEGEPITLSVSPENVTVRGAESRVDSVASARGTIDSGLVKEKESSFSMIIKGVDKKGNSVSYVSLSQSMVTVEAQLAAVKTVPVKAEIINNYSAEVERSFELPETITIMGSTEALANVEYIECEDVDISDITESCEISLNYILPEGVKIHENDAEKNKLTVYVENITEKSFEFKSEDVIINGLSENLSAELSDIKILVTVRGKESELEGFDAEKVRLSVNAESLTAGKHKVSISADTNSEFGTVRVEPKSISIIISEEANEDI